MDHKNMNYFHRLLNIIHQFFKAARMSLLASQFGYVSQCVHRPTCGDYTVKAIQSRGILGLFDGLLKTSKCLIIPSKRN